MYNTNINFYFTRQDSPEYVVSMHNHKCYELVYYFSGSGYCKIGKTDYNYDENTYVIIPPKAYHNDVHATPCNILCIGFNVNEATLPTGSFKDVTQNISRYVKIIIEEFTERKKDYLSAANSCLNNIIIEILRENTETVGFSSYSNALENFIEYVNENYLTSISPELIAGITNYSYDRFRHIFKHALGVSPKQYVLNKRIEHSKKLLSSTSLSVTEIAYQCGFGSSSLFTKHFRNNTGITPQSYRKQMYSATIFSAEQSDYDQR